MNHLKSYKLFESEDSILNDIEDILSPISDMGILVRVWSDGDIFSESRYNIVIGDYRKSFTLSENVDDIIRLDDYMKSIGYQLETRWFEDPNTQLQNKIEQMVSGCSSGNPPGYYVQFEFGYVKVK